MLEHVRPLRSLTKTVDARHYNRIRLALARVANPLRVELTQLGSLDMILGDREWLCVDRNRDDLPLMTWQDFSREDPHALHVPVRCTLHLYHIHSGMLMGRILPSLQQALEIADAD